MPQQMRRRQAIICATCNNRVLLGFLMRADDGTVRLHVKAYKANRIIVELYLAGDTYIRCRACKNWHFIEINGTDFSIHPAEEEAALAGQTVINA